MVYSSETNYSTVMNPIQDFDDALKEFRQICSEMPPPLGRGGNIKKFNTLDEFHEYHREPTYKKKTDRVYKKRHGIASKIKVDRNENPTEWHNQYSWFSRHPEADVYAPDHSRSHLGKVNRRGGGKQSEISKKITVRRSEDVKEYSRQYAWFKKHPEAEQCPPRKLKN